MASQSWVSLLNSATPQGSGAGTALSTAATATLSPCQAGALTADVAIVNAAGQPLGWYPGMIIRITAQGILTTTGTSTTATLLVALNKGNSSGWVTIGTAAGITTGTTVLSGINWCLEAIIRCTAVASSGNTIGCQGKLQLGNELAALPSNPVALSASPPPGFYLPIPNSGGETATAVDTTSIQGVGVRGTLAGANATLQCTSWIAEALD